MFRPVPDRLYATASPQAGEVLPANRHRRREEFHPDWGYICSPAATVQEVVAALLQSAHDVPDRMWERAIATHAPDAWQLLQANGWSFEQFVSGDVPAMSPVPNQIRNLVNSALDGYEVLHCFPVADLLHSVEQTLGATPEFH